MPQVIVIALGIILALILFPIILALLGPAALILITVVVPLICIALLAFFIVHCIKVFKIRNNDDYKLAVVLIDALYELAQEPGFFRCIGRYSEKSIIRGVLTKPDTSDKSDREKTMFLFLDLKRSLVQKTGDAEAAAKADEYYKEIRDCYSRLKNPSPENSANTAHEDERFAEEKKAVKEKKIKRIITPVAIAVVIAFVVTVVPGIYNRVKMEPYLPYVGHYEYKGCHFNSDFRVKNGTVYWTPSDSNLFYNNGHIYTSWSSGSELLMTKEMIMSNSMEATEAVYVSHEYVIYKFENGNITVNGTVVFKRVEE